MALNTQKDMKMVMRLMPIRRRCQKMSRMVVLEINTPLTLMKRNMNWLEDIARPHHRIGQSQPQQLSRVDHAEVGSQFNRTKSLDFNLQAFAGPL